MRVQINHPIFSEFLKNKEQKDNLIMARDIIKRGSFNMFLTAVNLGYANAFDSACFSDAWCDTKSEQTLFPISSIFRTGLSTIDNYLDGFVPKHKTARKALLKLLEYINSSIHDLKQADESDDEGCWTVKLAQHLLSQLAVGSKYTIDSQKSKFTKQKDKYSCPCEKKDMLVGSFGDTSFGCLEGWHGSVDILMEHVPVTIVANKAKGDSESSDSDDGNESAVEVTFAKRDIYQGIAQCITFSFLQKKECENKDKKMSNYLIPSLGLNKGQIHILFYDCEHDVLLTTCPVELFTTSGKNITVILLLWLTLNYKWFCSGITPTMRECRSKFFEFAGKSLSIYQNDVKRPAHQSNIPDYPFDYGVDDVATKDNMGAFQDMEYIDIVSMDSSSRAASPVRKETSRLKRTPTLGRPRGKPGRGRGRGRGWGRGRSLSTRSESEAEVGKTDPTPSSSRQPGSKRVAPQDFSGSPTHKRFH